jgi:hypothetical protein
MVAGKLLEDREHQLLLTERARILDIDLNIELFSEGQELSGAFGLEVLQSHFGHERKISVRFGRKADRERERFAELLAGFSRRLGIFKGHRRSPPQASLA